MLSKNTKTDPELESEFSEFHISTQISRPGCFPESYWCQIKSHHMLSWPLFLFTVWRFGKCGFLIFHRWFLNRGKSQVVSLISEKIFLCSLWRPDSKFVATNLYLLFLLYSSCKVSTYALNLKNRKKTSIPELLGVLRVFIFIVKGWDYLAYIISNRKIRVPL